MWYKLTYGTYALDTYVTLSASQSSGWDGYGAPVSFESAPPTDLIVDLSSLSATTATGGYQTAFGTVTTTQTFEPRAAHRDRRTAS